MPHSVAWDNTVPLGSELVSGVDDRIREMKLQIDERMSLDHIWADSLDHDGKHVKITLRPANNTCPIKVESANTLTGSDTSGLVDISQIWNTSGNVTGFKMDITDTASGASSLLLAIAVGGNAVFTVTKAGVANVLSASGVQAFSIDPVTHLLTLNSGAWGTGAVTGSRIIVGRNTSGSGAAGVFTMVDKGGTGYSLWVDDNGTMRYSTDPPQEDGTPSDTSGVALWNVGGTINVAGGSAAAPSITFSNSSPTTGLFFYDDAGGEYLGFARDSNEYAVFQYPTNDRGAALALHSNNFSTGPVTGNLIVIGRNASGNGAAGTLALVERDDQFRYFWSDNSGNLRAHTAQPTEDGTTVSDTAGTVVGTQTSWHEAKELVFKDQDTYAGLQRIRALDVYDFRYKNGSYGQKLFKGLVGKSRSDWFLKNTEPQQLPALDEISVLGNLILAVQELSRRVGE